ncbi:chemotaxis protein CheY [Novimethylophilus kurashikiensis]|uniref:Chemotaxis protein CheY n=1 Tax=Novimethylophilus kurashikiensis TaxID=1825523 RepID=A0A2R5F8U3_9PROT|nr:response regulator [Novimethylophilus kurashikiensis]GBG14660.1 chemotaxis protein CheY [Novimethylophilus kurashikiensis]
MSTDQFRLLIVDDEVDVLESLQRTFRGKYEIVTARGGDAAIRVLGTKHIDLILCDQRMPDVPGHEVLKFAMQHQPEAIRILLTGYADLESLVKCVNEGGLYKYMTKPWEPENLQLTVEFALEGLSLQRHLDVATGIIRKNHYFPKEMLDRLKQAAVTRGEPMINIIHRAINKELAVVPK